MPPRRPFTIIEDSQIIAMRNNGATIAQIALELHRNAAHISQRIKYITNDPHGQLIKRGVPFSTVEDDRIATMRSNNATITEIANDLRRDYRQISIRIRQLNLPLRARRRPYPSDNCPRCGILYTATGHPPTHHNSYCIICEQELNTRRK